MSALWLISAWAGAVTPAAEIESITAGSPIAAFEPIALARVTAGLDLLLALWLIGGRQPRTCIALMGVSVLGYTLLLGALLPALWLDPLGGLSKNLVVLPALATLWVLADKR